MPPKNKPMKPQDKSMKGQVLKAGDALRAKLSSMRPAVEKIGDKVQTMTGRKPAPKKAAMKAKPKGK